MLLTAFHWTTTKLVSKTTAQFVITQMDKCHGATLSMPPIVAQLRMETLAITLLLDCT
jgi:hypothetical protein